MTMGTPNADRAKSMKRGFRRWQSVNIRALWLCVISCFFLSVNLEVPAAQQNDPTVESETEIRDEKVQSQPWEPPPPPADEFDWIQLTSGEWLKGELKVLYRKKLGYLFSGPQGKKPGNKVT